MKYLVKHPIHETKNAAHDSYETHDEADVRKVHAHADAYAGAGEQPKVKDDKEHRLSHEAMVKPGGEETIDFHTAPDDKEQQISDIAEEDADAKSTIVLHGAGFTDDEQHISHVAERKIISFSDFR